MKSEKELQTALGFPNSNGPEVSSDLVNKIGDKSNHENMNAGTKPGTVSSAQKAYFAMNKEHWKSPIEFFLSCLGYAVGLGNIWRFPYLCMKHGGASFMVPYFFFLFFSGMPVYFAEVIVGQFTGLSPVRIFGFVPLFQGVGWAMLVISGILCVYYNLLMTYILFYLFSSFQWTLPWSSCYNSWNTDKCRELIQVNESTKITGWTYDPSSPVANVPVYRGTRLFADWNTSYSSAEEFWYHKVLRITDEPMQMGNLNWPLFGCLALAWLITAICLIRGIKSSGKVVYVTAVAPYLLLAVIMIRGLTLSGSEIGIRYYCIPDWSKLTDMKIWGSAAVQIFYSLGPCWGGLVTMASYNKFNHNCYRDSLVLPIIGCGTSIFGGFAVFSVLGHMAHLVGSDNFENLVQAGPGLAFIAYPEALSYLPGGCIWSVMFFLMLFTLGLDSQFATLETVTSGFIERFPYTIGKYRKTFIIVVCLGQCLLGVPFVFEGGFYIFTIMDTYSTPFSVIFIGLAEMVAFAYFYDGRKMIRHLRLMVGDFCLWLRPWWYFTWYCSAPLCLLLVIVTTCMTYEAPVSREGIAYPGWSVDIGWTIAALGIISMPTVAFYKLWEYRHEISKVIKPSETFETLVTLRQKGSIVTREMMVDPLDTKL